MRICNKCRKQCSYRNVGFEGVTLYLEDHCAYDFKKECDEIATEDFRRVIQTLKDGNFKTAGVAGILKQAQCILNAADNKIVT